MMNMHQFYIIQVLVFTFAYLGQEAATQGVL